MAKGVEKNALGVAGNATNQAQASYGTLAPQLTQMATNPVGYSPQSLANMTTASMQSAGGSVAGAVGQGNLQAARTNNAGGYVGALDDAARVGSQVNSQNALGVQNQNAQLQNQQQMFGLSGLQNLYSGANSTSVNALNAATSASKATNDAQQGWTSMGLNWLNPKNLV